MGIEDTIPEEEKKKRTHNNNIKGFNSPNKHGDYKNEDWLREQYILKDRSQNDIAEECDVNKGTIRYWRNKFNIHKGRECPLCEHQSEALGTHFKQSPHGYPELTRRQKELLVGMVMGDAWYNKNDGGLGQIGWEMKNLEFMKWLSEELSWLCSEPTVRRTPEEHAKVKFLEDRKFGSASPEDYNTTYSCYTIAHPWMSKLDWVRDGVKQYPENIEITPTVLKMWHCGDGHISFGVKDRGGGEVRITCVKEKKQLKMLKERIEEKTSSPELMENGFRFKREETKQVLEYMGTAPKGFEYKFETESYERHQRLKNE